jgi:hypothetical protein
MHYRKGARAQSFDKTLVDPAQRQAGLSSLRPCGKKN